MLRVHDVGRLGRVLEHRPGHDGRVGVLASSCRRARAAVRMATAIVEPLAKEPLPGGRDALEQDLADEVVAEAEAEPVDAEDAPLAQALELLEELGCVDAEQVGERLGLERLLEQRGGDEDAVCPVALGAALGEQRVGQCLATGAAWCPLASASATKRGSPPVDSCSSGIPSGARSSGESGSSSTRRSARGGAAGGPARSRSAARSSRGRLRDTRPAAQVAERGERARVGEVEVVEEQHDGRVLATSATSASSASISSNVRFGAAQRELGQDLLSAGRHCASSSTSGERFAKRGRERHVRQMPLEPEHVAVRRGRRRARAAARRAGASCRARPRLRSGSAVTPSSDSARIASDERVELGPRARRGARQPGRERRHAQRRIGRGSSEWTSSWRMIAASSARVSALGSRPSSSSSRMRKSR